MAESGHCRCSLSGHLDHNVSMVMQRLIRRPSACLAAAFVTMTLLSAPLAAVSADTVAASGGAPRTVNVTSDSVPGWLPSEDLERQARKTAIDFMADMDMHDDLMAFIAPREGGGGRGRDEDGGKYEGGVRAHVAIIVDLASDVIGGHCYSLTPNLAAISAVFKGAKKGP